MKSQFQLYKSQLNQHLFKHGKYAEVNICYVAEFQVDSIAVLRQLLHLSHDDMK